MTDVHGLDEIMGVVRWSMAINSTYLIRHGPVLGGFFCTGLLHLAKFFGGFAIRLTLSKHTQIVYMKALLNTTYTEECSRAP